MFKVSLCALTRRGGYELSFLRAPGGVSVEDQVGGDGRGGPVCQQLKSRSQSLRGSGAGVGAGMERLHSIRPELKPQCWTFYAYDTRQCI